MSSTSVNVALCHRLAVEAFADMCPGASVDASAITALAHIIDEERRTLDASAVRLAAHCGRSIVDAESVRLAAHVHALLVPPSRAHTAAYARAQNARTVEWPSAIVLPAESGSGVQGMMEGSGAAAAAAAAVPAVTSSTVVVQAGTLSGSAATLTAALSAGKRARPITLTTTFS